MKTAITGGKGGTGKSVVAVNLAAELAKKSTVTLIDCDVDCPNDHLLLGAKLENEKPVYSYLPKFDREKCVGCGICAKKCGFNAIYLVGKKPNLVEKLCSGCTLCQHACPAQAISAGKKTIGHTYETKKNGVRLVTGVLKPGEPVSAKLVSAAKKRGFGKKTRHYLLDTAAGTHCTVVEALIDSDKALVVTEPTPFGKHDLKLIQKVLKKLKIPSETILNRSNISKTRIENAAEIPYDKEVIESYNEGKPLVALDPNHPVSKIFRRIGEELCKK